MDEFQRMRSFIMATEHLGQEAGPEEISEAVVSRSSSGLLEDLDSVVFKLRAFMESCGGEFAMGVETGMQRAADMIENAVKRHCQGD